MLKILEKNTNKLKYIRFKVVNYCINNGETEMAAWKEVVIAASVFN